MAADHKEVISLTLAGGYILRVRRSAVIAAHHAAPSHVEAYPDAKTKVYLSSGEELFVQDAPEEACR